MYREYDAPDKTIGQACDTLLSLSKDEDIELWLAPPDLWNRDQITGKSRALHFEEYGVSLTKTLNRLEDGCAAMKEWLLPVGEDNKASLMFLEDAAPNLYRCLQKIQKDKRKPNVYAKEPHDLTHDVDSLRCFCVYWTSPAKKSKTGTSRKWTQDMYEDYQNANKEDKIRLIEKYGEPDQW